MAIHRHITPGLPGETLSASVAQASAPRVSEKENREVDGFAYAHKSVLDRFLSKVDETRQRHEAYKASLPKDEASAIAGALSILHADETTDLPHGLLRAQHLSVALDALLRDSDAVQQEEATFEAVQWIAKQMAQDLGTVRAAIDRCKDILSNPAKNAAR